MKQLDSRMLVVVMAAAAILPGCFGDKRQDGQASSSSAGSSEALISFNDKPVMTAAEFKQKLAMIQASQPGLENALASMPEKDQLSVYAQFADGCTVDIIIREHVKEKGLDQTPGFIKMREQVLEAVEGNLRAQAFQEEVSKEVIEAVNKMSDTELRSYYEENRDKNPYFKRPPFTLTDKNDKKDAAPKYAPFESVREQVKQVIQQVRFNEAMQQKIEQLKQKYGAKIESSCLQQFVVKNPNATVPAPDEEKGAAAVVPAQAA